MRVKQIRIQVLCLIKLKKKKFIKLFFIVILGLYILSYYFLPLSYMTDYD